MKIITKKKADEILKRITANEIIGIECIEDIEAHTKFIENNANIVYEVGGIKGIVKVQNTLEQRLKHKGVTENDREKQVGR